MSHPEDTHSQDETAAARRPPGAALFAAVADGVVRIEPPADRPTPNEALALVPEGVYEGVRTYGGTRVFALGPHLDRLERSIEAEGLDVLWDRDAVVRGLAAAIERFHADTGGDARVRFDVAAAPATALGVDSALLYALTPFAGVPERDRARGVHVRTTTDLVRPRPRVKTSAFVRMRDEFLARPEVEPCYEYVMRTKDGRLLEGVQSNVVVLVDGALRTAPEDVLQGVTRDVVLGLAADAGHAVERDYPRVDDLARADETFLTSSVRGVVPIVGWDDVVIGDGRPGAVTRSLMERYDALAEREARPVA